MEWVSTNIGWIVQTFVLILALGAAREKMNVLDKKVDRLETAVVQIARQDERLLAMDQRVLAQGKRIDRLENARRPSKKDEEND